MQSIYPEYVSSQTLDGDIKLEIPVEFDNAKTVKISEESPWTPTSGLQERAPNTLSISVSTLPPLLVHIVLPPSYPLHSPPDITSIRATNVWLAETTQLQSALVDMWEAGEPTLYNWVEYIRSGEFLCKLGILSSVDSDSITCVILKSIAFI